MAIPTARWRGFPSEHQGGEGRKSPSARLCAHPARGLAHVDSQREFPDSELCVSKDECSATTQWPRWAP